MSSISIYCQWAGLVTIRLIYITTPENVICPIGITFLSTKDIATEGTNQDNLNLVLKQQYDKMLND